MSGAAGDADVTLGEVNRAVERIERTVASIDARLTAADERYVRTDLYRSDSKDRDRRIGGLETNQSRMVWALVTLVVTLLGTGVTALTQVHP